MRRRLTLPAALLAAVALALGACGEADETPGVQRSSAEAVDAIPVRTTPAQAVEPIAGESAATAALPAEDPADQSSPSGAPARSPSKRVDSGPTQDDAISKADVLKNGIALPPIEAPEAVRSIIEAGNSIARTPYLWGGGHGKWLDKGYDCSGSVSYALAAAGLLNAPLDSGRLMRWGKPGRGKWVTIYTNPGHVYLVVAGVRFDTSGTRTTGSRWQKGLRGVGGYVARHPPGL